MHSTKPIMLIEDDYVDAMTLKRALRELKVVNDLVHRTNGEEALDYLRDRNNIRPCVIFLDVNMPKMNGMEFLQIAKADSELRCIPVIVFTTSKNEWDRFESFNLSAAGYIVKPADYKSFVEAIKTVELYWTLCEFPDEPANMLREQVQSHACSKN
jgi:CheY-like chemotaxis protein